MHKHCEHAKLDWLVDWTEVSECKGGMMMQLGGKQISFVATQKDTCSSKAYLDIMTIKVWQFCGNVMMIKLRNWWYVVRKRGFNYVSVKTNLRRETNTSTYGLHQGHHVNIWINLEIDLKIFVYHDENINKTEQEYCKQYVSVCCMLHSPMVEFDIWSLNW